MLKIYKNEIHRVLKDVHKIDANRFVIIDGSDDGLPFTKISTIDSKMSFWFKNAINSWDKFYIRNSKFNPKFNISDWNPPLGTSAPLTFADALKHFDTWINNHVKRYFEEIDIADKWNEFNFETNIFQLTQIKIGDNSNFTLEQSKQISTSIDKLKQLIIEKFKPTSDQLTHIEERLDYLETAINRLGKFDWTNTFVSLMISIAINMSFDTETGKAFLELIKEAFSAVSFLLQ